MAVKHLVCFFKWKADVFLSVSASGVWLVLQLMALGSDIGKGCIFLQVPLCGSILGILAVKQLVKGCIIPLDVVQEALIMVLQGHRLYCRDQILKAKMQEYSCFSFFFLRCGTKFLFISVAVHKISGE